MNSSLFITFEGPDGSGKSTQVRMLSNYLKEKGFDVLITREPGGTPISERIRKIILNPENKEMAAATEALLYAASRAQHVQQLIKPALKAGKIVISDRFMDSSIAYQGFGRNLGDDVRIINEFAVQGLKPDLSFFMDIDPAAGIKRISSGRGMDRLEQEKLEFHYKVYEGYKALYEADKARYKRIDATLNSNAIHNIIVKLFEEYVMSRA